MDHLESLILAGNSLGELSYDQLLPLLSFPSNLKMINLSNDNLAILKLKIFKSSYGTQAPFARTFADIERRNNRETKETIAQCVYPKKLLLVMS